MKPERVSSWMTTSASFSESSITRSRSGVVVMPSLRCHDFRTSQAPTAAKPNSRMQRRASPVVKPDGLLGVTAQKASGLPKYSRSLARSRARSLQPQERWRDRRLGAPPAVSRAERRDREGRLRAREVPQIEDIDRRRGQRGDRLPIERGESTPAVETRAEQRHLVAVENDIGPPALRLQERDRTVQGRPIEHVETKRQTAGIVANRTTMLTRDDDRLGFGAIGHE